MLIHAICIVSIHVAAGFTTDNQEVESCTPWSQEERCLRISGGDPEALMLAQRRAHRFRRDQNETGNEPQERTLARDEEPKLNHEQGLTTMDVATTQAQIAEKLSVEMTAFIAAFSEDAVRLFENLRTGIIVTNGTEPHPAPNVTSDFSYGYIQALRSTPDMARFITILLLAAGSNPMPSSGDITGLAQFYSGEKGAQPWYRLWEEMKDKKWLPNGTNASLTEAGYVAVAAQKSNKEMKEYVLQLIRAENAEVLSQASLDGMIPFFSGVKSTQSLAKLKADLRKKASTENWLKYMDNQTSGLEALTGDEDDEERRPAGQWPTTLQEMEEGNSFMVQRLASEMLSFIDKAIPRVFEALRSTKDALMNHQRVDTANLFSSQVTGSGFEMVQSLRNTPKMLAFMKLVLQAAGNSAPDEQVLAGLAPWFSGESATQPWSRLVEELREKGLFPKGAHAALTEAGYMAMALHNNNTDTEDFVHRVAVADSLGYQTWQSLALRHGVNGSAKDRSLKGLRKELRDGDNSDNMLHLIKTNAAANSSVFKAPLVRAFFTEMEESQRNCALPAFMNPAATNERMLSSMMILAKQILSATLESLDNARLLLITSEIPRGKVPFFNHVNRFGFESIQALRQKPVMETFMRMLVQSYGGSIPDNKKVRNLADLYNGDQVNWDTFWQYMSDMRWLPHGSTAAFTESGYQAVSTWKDHQEMKDYIKRFIKSEGGRVLYEPGLDYFVLYYSGEQAVQSLHEMRIELRQKAILEGWLEFPSPSPLALPLDPAVATDRLTSEMFAFLRKGVSATVEAFDRLRESVAGMKPANNVSLFHDEVSLEAGYQILQNTRNSAAMEMYIQMLLSSTGASQADQATLHGIAPLYSGEQDSQSWNDLWADLARREWLPKGSAAALTEAGYQSVALLKDSSEMEAFVLRVIKEDGGVVLRPSGLQGFLPRFDGEERVQSLSAMRSELHGEAQGRGWVKFEGRELCSMGSAEQQGSDTSGGTQHVAGSLDRAFEGARPELARGKAASPRANLLMAAALLTLACMYHA